MNCLNRCIAIVSCIFLPLFASGQSPLTEELLRIKTSSDNSNRVYSAEQLYLQFDKPYYALNDTLWFKGWLFNAPTLELSAKSGLVYVDIANDSSKAIKHYRLLVHDGIILGNISLEEKEYTAGSYTLHAYTSWMRNFGEEHFFYKQFTIAGNGEKAWLVNTNTGTTRVNNQDKVNTKLQFYDSNNVPAAVIPMTLQVSSRGENLYKQKVQSDVNGLLDVNFLVPAGSREVTLNVESESREHKMSIPLHLDRPENTDLQFLPEGGSLVGGQPATVGFKAISKDGRGADLSGTITDRQGKQVASFKSLHKGMGRFQLLPVNGESYTANITLPGGAARSYPLPPVKSTGTALRVDNPADKDSLEITVSVTDDQLAAHASYFLTGKSREVMCYGAVISINKSNSTKIRISKKLFPTGIARLLLQNTSGQPLNERQVFINHQDTLKIALSSKETYAPGDSIALEMQVTDHKDNPVQGNFSLAVTDDAQVKIDSNAGNIISNVLLTSGLKGNVEQPGYYFGKQDTITWQALDNLLLTQGWVGYDTVATPLKYPAETELNVTGRVLNGFNKPVKATKVQMFSKSPLVVQDTLTDNNGVFTFRNIPRADTPIFVLNALNRSGKRFNVGIEITDSPPPAFQQATSPLLPWYVNSSDDQLYQKPGFH